MAETREGGQKSAVRALCDKAHIIQSYSIYYHRNHSRAPPNVQSRTSQFCTEIRWGVQENGHQLL
jgi:hypothetical protein